MAITLKTNFDYSGFPESLKINSIERLASIKANEKIAGSALYAMAKEIKKQHDEMNDFARFLEWCELELDYKPTMAKNMLRIGRQLGHYSDQANLPKTFKGLLTIADYLANTQDEEESKKIFSEIDEKTALKGDDLTVKELKSIIDEQKYETKKLKQEKKQLSSQIADLEEKVVSAKELVRKDVERELDYEKKKLESEKQILNFKLKCLEKRRQDTIHKIFDYFKKLEREFGNNETVLIDSVKQSDIVKYKAIIFELEKWSYILKQTIEKIDFIDSEPIIDIDLEQ